MSGTKNEMVFAAVTALKLTLFTIKFIRFHIMMVEKDAYHLHAPSKCNSNVSEFKNCLAGLCHRYDSKVKLNYITINTSAIH